ncbi:MAG TPA: hypothetical protein VFV66_04635 [Nonomuraea sp.]|nr:hypothetical protein [Nonomuraea sp.]
MDPMTDPKTGPLTGSLTGPLEGPLEGPPISAVVADIMPFVTAAVAAYGVGVLARTSELAAGTAVARGGRILQRVFGRGDAGARRAIERMAEGKPDDQASLAALRLALAQALGADPLLPREVAAMLPGGLAVSGTAPASPSCPPR